MKKLGVKKVLGLGLGAALLACSALSHAADPVYDTGWSTVDRIDSWNDASVYLSNDNGKVYNQCFNDKHKNRYILSAEKKANEYKFSILLSAQVSQQKVNVRYSCGDNGYPYIEAVRFMHSK